MRKRVLNLEPYEAPQINYLLAEVELGFAGTSLGEDAGGDLDGKDDEWNQPW